MLQNLTGWHALLLLAVVLLIFGAAKLPALARSVGQSVRILKDESKDAAADCAAKTVEVEGTLDDPSESGGHAVPVRTSPSMTG